MKKLITKIKTTFFFNILSILLLIGITFLYIQFETIKDKIVDTNLNAQIEYTQNISDKLIQSIKYSVSKGDLEYTLKKDKKLRELLEEHLSMFITKRYRFVYVVTKANIGTNQFKILLDGSTNQDEKSEFGELFVPVKIDKWESAYKEKKTLYFQQKDQLNLWMTFIKPIIINNKIEGLLVIDFALEDHKAIVANLHQLDENFEAIVVIFIILFFLLLLFSYFDLQREKEKENIQKQILDLNHQLEDRIEQEIKKSRKKDQQIIQQSRLAQMGEMISMIAHQWRQPLSAISSSSGAIVLKAKLGKLDNEKAVQIATKISQYSQHLSSTIDDFREFFKPNKIKVETNLNDIINGVLNIVESSIENKNIKIIKNLNSSSTFESYPNELKQVVLNLIKNAEDILVEKQIEQPYINITTYEHGEKLILDISDNGGGIPKDILDKIFDPYFSTKTKKDGTGLGLYMSKTIIEDHCSGQISISNNENGALFSITIFK